LIDAGNDVGPGGEFEPHWWDYVNIHEPSLDCFLKKVLNPQDSCQCSSTHLEVCP
jgi:hypothetical protein